jgi:hypothetical protein
MLVLLQIQKQDGVPILDVAIAFAQMVQHSCELLQTLGSHVVGSF